jgi:hypothetical protein
MRCRPGDMAVIVDAFNKCNLGKIVTVIGLHDGAGDLLLKLDEPVWLVSCCVPLIWSTDKKRWRRKNGPAGDSALQPIRGIPVEDLEAISCSNHRVLADLIV